MDASRLHRSVALWRRQARASTTGQGQALNDTFLQIAAAFATFYGDGSPGTNAEKIARLARGE